MLREINAVRNYFKEKLGEGINPAVGVYAIPYETLKGKAFMRVEVSPLMNLSDFTLWFDEDFTKSYYV